MDSDDFRIELLGKSHNREAFSCGRAELDRYLKTIARQDAAKSVAAVFVLTDGETVAGFYTLSQSSMDLRLVPERMQAKLPKYPDVPVTLLGRLAVDSRFRGLGMGAVLLLDALKQAHSVSSVVASAMVVVDAKDAAARTFYEHYGFGHLRELPDHLILAMDTVEQVIGKRG